MNQLCLLSPVLLPLQPDRAELRIQPVLERLALGPNRFFLVAVQGDRQWAYPIRFTEVEARWILPEVEHLDWTLNGNGVPVFAEEIHAAIEQLVDQEGGKA